MVPAGALSIDEYHTTRLVTVECTGASSIRSYPPSTGP